jgi:adenine deaminase
MNTNFDATFEALGLTAPHAYQLAKNSFDASFASQADLQRYSERLAAFMA